MIAYRVVKGAKDTATRKGMVVVAPSADAVHEWMRTHHPSTLWFGSLRHCRNDLGRVAEVFVVDGDPAVSYEDAPQGWGEYAYTHGGEAYRARCGIAHDLWAAEWPEHVETVGVVLERLAGAELERVREAWERSEAPRWHC